MRRSPATRAQKPHQSRHLMSVPVRGSVADHSETRFGESRSETSVSSYLNDQSESLHDFSLGFADEPVLVGDGASKSFAAAQVPSRGFSPIDLRDRVVIMLLFKQVVTIGQVGEAWIDWKSGRERGEKEMLWRVIARRDDVDREQIFAEAAEAYAFTCYAGSVDQAIDVCRALKKRFKQTEWEAMRRMGVMPVWTSPAPDGSSRYAFGAFDPTHPDIQRFVKNLHIGLVDLVYVPESTLNTLKLEVPAGRNEYLDRMSEDSMAYDLGTTYDREHRIDEDALNAEINRSTLINLFEATLVEAVRCGASDIHIWPNAQRKIEIHFRIDGELARWHIEDRVHPEAFLAVVKDNALNIDRFERDMGQDGFLQRRIDDTLIRFRVSVIPLANASHEMRAESIVLRVLDDRMVVADVRDLGFLDVAMKRFEQAIQRPHGMVVVTGPTGSGKSTTLYAALNQVASPKLNILTIEDPVEYVLPVVRQVKLTHKFSLEDALRSILRHDPDVVMVGEMRDRVTADLAIKLSNTGHLTFSTLHTNDAASAVSRLYKMGIEPFLIAYAVNLVVAQRLIKRLCPDCREIDVDVEDSLLAQLGFADGEAPVVYRAGHRSSCKTCQGTGYKGRRAVTEAMPFTKSIRRYIVQAKEDIDEDVLREIAISEGMLTLRDCTREYVRSGETSIEEMVRATVTED